MLEMHFSGSQGTHERDTRETRERPRGTETSPGAALCCCFFILQSLGEAG